MKNIIPFKKEVMFKTKLSEVVSISLEHTLNIEKDKVVGEFIVSGDYKINSNSSTVDPFNLKIPFEICIDEKYDTSNAVVEIDDFYYEIVNDNILSISIDVLVDRLEEIHDELIDLAPERKVIEELFEDEYDIEEKKETENNEIKDLDSNFFSTYKIYIIKENETIETVLEKYNIEKDELAKYNNLSEIRVGDKIIIPSINEGN